MLSAHLIGRLTPPCPPSRPRPSSGPAPTPPPRPQVLCYASKSEAMYVRDSLIFRSDSNGEDLEGYAGAGLYESITMDPCELTKVRACICMHASACMCMHACSS